MIEYLFSSILFILLILVVSLGALFLVIGLSLVVKKVFLLLCNGVVFIYMLIFLGAITVKERLSSRASKKQQEENLEKLLKELK